MSNLPKFEISRSSLNGHWNDLYIKLLNCDIVWPEGLGFVNGGDDDEDDAVVDLLEGFFDSDDYSDYLTVENVEQSIVKITEGFRQLRENDLDGNSEESMEISLVPQEQPEPHFSCKMNKNGYDTTQSSELNEISQSEVQQKLAIVEKENKVMTFFEDNKCSVCLSSYKEMLDDNLHIVVPSCGHPLCCACADNILKSTKKECPRCRGNITADSFSLMKFNADLQMEAQDQTVFL